MRLAIIADIHGNLQALKAVLDDIKKRNIKNIIVNGDLVNRGFSNVEVIETLLKIKNIKFTLGNHDDFLSLWHTKSKNLPQSWFNDNFWGAVDYNAKSLSKNNLIGFEKNFPMVQIIETKHPLLICHASPLNYRIGLSDKTDKITLKEASQNYNYVISSHIHRPVVVQRNNILLGNTGGVGVSIDQDARASYLIAEYNIETAWKFKIIRLNYDIQTTLESFNKEYLSSVSGQIFYHEIHTAKSLYTPYWEWTENNKIEKNFETWNFFTKEILKIHIPEIKI